VEVPTFREEPWERDRRAIEDRARRLIPPSAEVYARQVSVGRRRREVARSRIGAGVMVRRSADPGVFLRSPAQRRIAWFVLLFLFAAADEEFVVRLFW
jgi:hypothetical protein